MTTKVTLVNRPRCAKPRPIYYKTECFDCELITSVRWEQKYMGIMPAYSRPKAQLICPFCQGTHIKTLEIHELEYQRINQQWELVTAAEATDNIDWQSWIVD
ncbi:hypothetical protein BGP_0386 [Beggiatoa sp. PS]|nr:hypothetical protein BGP_0386 [Beggiatoa sp. PS]